MNPPRLNFVAPCLRASVPVVARAFSMLETTIAVSILGVGLIMVAAVFPVALSQHQTNAEQAAALELITKAAAFLHANIDPTRLYVPVPPGTDSPWYLLPTVNIASGATVWDPMLQGTAPNHNLYANLVSDFDRLFGPQPAIRTGNFPDYLFSAPEFPASRQRLYSGLDFLSDRMSPIANSTFSPLTDAEMQDAPNRFVWYAFYRHLATGQIQYSVTVCKQRRNDFFREQDMVSGTSPFAIVQGFRAVRRLPIPWRITIGLEAARRFRSLPPPLGGGWGLGELAPPGSKILIQGASYGNGAPAIPVPPGRILTVARTVDYASVETLEDTADLPILDFSNSIGTTFDILLFPPAAQGPDSTVLAKDSPVMAWRANL